jgi:hypothetical protein
MAGLRWFGPQVTQLIEQAAMRGLDDGIDKISETSQERVPVESGALKRSGRTSRQGLTVGYYYTDPKAAAAHENLTVNYRTRRQAQARAKFLESAGRDRGPDALRDVADAIRKVL